MDTAASSFEKPSGVVNAKKAKHWIAFAVIFLVMAVQFDPQEVTDRIPLALDLDEHQNRVRYIYHPDFEEQFID